MWREHNGKWQYQTGTGADNWADVRLAVAVDAGNNRLDDAPAGQHEALERKYARDIDAGRVNVIGE